ncbi:MAG: phosphatidylglycerol lysyltransferase domain-containing protein [Clostridia bacterium]|nr:phosphatidylglycerol lysyltransferase domain-containing protein [Clostridia bacterium]
MHETSGKAVTLGGWTFNKIDIDDLELFSGYIAKTQYPANLWSSSFAYLWAISQSGRRDVLWRIVDGMLAVFSHTGKGSLYLLCLPFGWGDAEKVVRVVLECLHFCLEFNGQDSSKTMVKTVNENQLEFIKSAGSYADALRSVTWQGIERHYDVPRLCALAGKDFEKVRNRVNKFRRDHPDAVISRYRKADFDALMLLGEHWSSTAGKKYAKVFDTVYYREILRHNDELGQTTLVVRAGGRIVGMISGARLPTGDAWGSLVKFEEDIPGLSETLIVEYARILHRYDPGIRLLNVGSDLGSGGLRDYKMKFRPVLNLKRYQLFLKTV